MKMLSALFLLEHPAYHKAGSIKKTYKNSSKNLHKCSSKHQLHYHNNLNGPKTQKPKS